MVGTTACEADPARMGLYQATTRRPPPQPWWAKARRWPRPI